MASKNIILVGDHMQLPKPKTGKQEGNASLSPVEYIMEDKNTIADSRGIFLNKTYRMHDNISNYISENFYENRLKPDINNDKQNIIIEKNPLNGIYLIDLNHAYCFAIKLISLFTRFSKNFLFLISFEFKLK